MKEAGVVAMESAADGASCELLKGSDFAALYELIGAQDALQHIAIPAQKEAEGLPGLVRGQVAFGPLEHLQALVGIRAGWRKNFRTS